MCTSLFLRPALRPRTVFALLCAPGVLAAKAARTGTVAFDETELDVDFVDGGELKQQYTLLEAGAITGTYEAPLASLPSQFRGTISQDANRLNMSLAYVGGNFNFSALGRGVKCQRNVDVATAIQNFYF